MLTGTRSFVFKNLYLDSDLESSRNEEDCNVHHICACQLSFAIFMFLDNSSLFRSSLAPTWNEVQSFGPRLEGSLRFAAVFDPV